MRNFTALACTIALMAAPAPAANTEPTMALLRASAARASSGRVTLTIEASISFADAVQLALPVDIIVTQGARSAHLSLAGAVAVSVSGGPLQPAPGPGVIGVTERSIVLVLPAEFAPGAMTAQVVATYDDQSIASNVLRFTI